MSAIGLQDWDFNVQLKKFLKEATQKPRFKEKKTAIQEFLEFDQIKQVLHYAPMIYDWNRDSYYNEIYLRAFWEAHETEENYGMDSKNFFDLIDPSILIPSILKGKVEIYDIGGGLGYWGHSLGKLIPESNFYIVEKKEMINTIMSLYRNYRHLQSATLLTPEAFKDRKLYRSSPHVFIMGSFLHLFTQTEAYEILTALKDNILWNNLHDFSIVVIEPEQGKSPLLGYQMMDQMLAMTGKISCYDKIRKILEEIFGVFSEYSTNDYTVLTFNSKEAQWKDHH